MSSRGKKNSSSSTSTSPSLSPIPSSSSQNEEKKSDKSSSSTFWIGALIVAFLAAAGATAYFGSHAFSSTSTLAEINGDNLPKAQPQRALATVPTPQFNVDQRGNRVHPAVRPLEKKFQASSAMAVRFRSLHPKDLTIYYDNGREGVFQGRLRSGQVTTTNSYLGHKFYFVDKEGNTVYRLQVSSGQSLYIVEEEGMDAPHLASLRKQVESEFAFQKEYFERTGLLWRHYYGPDGPRPPPHLYMWPAENVGDVHSVTSLESKWFCDGPAAECRSVDPVHVELEVISTEPRAFVIENFISDFEADWIKKLAADKLAESRVGGASSNYKSDTRTSHNSWLGIESSDIIQSLYMRAADVLQIPQSQMTYTIAEQLQVVHYQDGQEYKAHHDWGVTDKPNSRYLTLLLYLTDMASPTAGGETAFPKVKGDGVKVHPGKGGAVLFYNLLPDGNGDDLSLHAALPCVEGEKWLANFWIWDPEKNNL